MTDADFCNALVTGVERVTAWSGATPIVLTVGQAENKKRRTMSSVR